PRRGEAGSRYRAAVDGRERVADTDSGARSRAIGVEQHHATPGGDEHAQTWGLAQIKRGRDAGHRHQEREQSQPHLSRGDAPRDAEMGGPVQPGTPRPAWGSLARWRGPRGTLRHDASTPPEPARPSHAAWHT